MDRGIAGDRSRHVTLRLCRALQFASWAATDAVFSHVAHAFGGAVSARGPRQPGPDWRGHWLRLRIGVQPCLQTPIRRVTWWLASTIGLRRRYRKRSRHESVNLEKSLSLSFISGD